MSDEGDKTCPLCAEEMDLTDQQLKPCKCGYDICVWCWHHIMDMAEKDETEGRCPACRTPYNKEKIVGTASSCGRLVPEMNGEKKKATKGRNRTSEGRKQLASVRVIQRNLVYVVGLPLSFAEEDLLQRKEFFARYGKVLKVSVSRTSTGAIQHFANNTCSVYITYSKEEDAVRCIQSVHGFVLDGKPLRACFGTTKYCHAWLRNMPCSNPECLYLHEIGSQEDSFTKDEIISAYTRVEQITGSSNSTERRSGNVLPPPADEYCNNTASTGKPISKSGVNTNNSAINDARVSPPNSSSGRSSALPAGASWGTRASNTQQPLLESMQSSNEPVKQKLDICNGPGARSTGKMLVHGEECNVPQNKSKSGTFVPWKQDLGSDMRIIASESSLGSAHSIALPLNTHDQPATELPCNTSNIVDFPLAPNGQVAGSTAALGQKRFPSLHSDNGKVLAPNEDNNISQDTSKTETSEPVIKESDVDKRIHGSDSDFGFVHTGVLPLNRQNLGQPVSELPPYKTNIVNSSIMLGMASDKDADDVPGGNIEDLCSDFLSMSTTENQILETGSGQHVRETVTSQLTGATGMKSAEIGLIDVQPDFSLGRPTQVSQVALPVLEDDLLSFEKQRTNDPEFSAFGKPDFVHMTDLSTHSNFFSSQFNNAESSMSSVGLDTHVVDRIGNLIKATSNISRGYPQTMHGIPEVKDVEYASLVPSKEKRLLPGRFAGEVVRGAFDTGESSIISNILSMDFDSLDEPLTSSQNLAKLLGETDKSRGHLGLSGSLRIHDSNQSRFSFAREDELFSQRSDHAETVGFVDHGFKPHVLGGDYSNRNGWQNDKHESYTNFPVINGAGSDPFYGIHSNLSSNRLSGSRSQVSAPPGFLGPSRAPPPGFASHDRREQNLDTVSGNHVLESSSFLRKQYQAPPVDNNAASNGDIELIDPAILAVGKGMLPSCISNSDLDLRPNYSSQFSTYEEARLQPFLQRSLPQHLNQRFTNFGASNSSLTDPYRIPSSNSSFSDPYRVPSDSYASLGNPYGIPSRTMDQTLTSSLSPFSQFVHPQSTSVVTSNGQWDGWNEIHSGTNLGIAEQLRAEKMGFNKIYGGYEDSKIRMPSSGNLYDRTYGI